MKHISAAVLVMLLIAGAVHAQTQPATTAPSTARITMHCNQAQGPLEIHHIALGQGGLSSEPMFSSRIAEIRALHPGLVRLFCQEYYNLLPARGQYHFDTLDRAVDDIVRTGASPLMCICFKPRALFLTIDQRKVEPADYDAWDALITELVKHCTQRHPGSIRYWEIGNEVDIGESGGCPYLFTPDSYVRYYRHTAAAILRADPDARVGGPALASARSAILPAFLSACEADHLPLHFVSWHIYSSSPRAIRATITYVQSLLKQHPSLKPETILDEWNMDLGNPPLAPAFQPCFVLETAWQMKEARLDWSCYYHIRDYHVNDEEFRPFFSPAGVAFMARWWNRMPQADGLFDFQDHVRPTYFAFELLSRLTGDRLRLDLPGGGGPAPHGFATHDRTYRIFNLLLWNFTDAPLEFELSVEHLPGSRMLVRQITLDAAAASDDENARLRPRPPARLNADSFHQTVKLDPYGVKFWSLE